MTTPTIQAVREFLVDLQARICQALEAQEHQGGFNLNGDGASDAKFFIDDWERPIEQGGGGGRSCVM